MMFIYTRTEQGFFRVRHEGPITVSDSRRFRAFLRNYRGKLLIDMTGAPAADMRRELLRVRPMLPQTACFGPVQQRLLCDELPGKDFYMNELRHFETEAEALAWLAGDEAGGESGDEAAAAA